MPHGIISIEGLSFTYPGSGYPLLKNLDLEIEQGDFAAVIGSNGCGKTTLCKALNGLIPQYITGDFAGKVLVGGKNTLENSVASLAKHIAYVYQDFENQLVRSTVYQDVIFAPLNFGYTDYIQRGMQALEILGLEHVKDRFIWELSGGQKHLTALAGVLSLDPEIIVVDEPAAQLDPANAVQVYENLKKLHKDYGKTIIVIEHNTQLIADYCHSVILMDQGRVFWQKPVEEALNRVNDLKERNIYPPQVTQAADFLSRAGVEKNGFEHFPVRIAGSKIYFSGLNIRSGNNSHPAGSHQASGAHQPEAAVWGSRKPAVIFQGVTHGYKTMANTVHNVLADIDLTVYQGDRLALVGSNGAGKSTLLKLISGIIRPQNGSVVVCDTDTRHAPPERLAETVAYIFQNPEEMFIDDCVRKDIEYFFKARKYPNLDILVDQVLKCLQLEELQNANGRLLSGGQQRRTSLAIGLATHASVILLDEPTGSLDTSSRKEMAAMLEYLKDMVKTVIIATHDMELVAEWANRIVVMKDGRILEDSNKYNVFGNKDLLKEAHLKPPQIVDLCYELDIKPVVFSISEFANRLESAKDRPLHEKEGRSLV